MNRITIKAAKSILSSIGYSLRHNDGEYRVYRKGGDTRTDYFTSDLEDAIATAQDMARRDNSRREPSRADIASLFGAAL